MGNCVPSLADSYNNKHLGYKESLPSAPLMSLGSDSETKRALPSLSLLTQILPFLRSEHIHPYILNTLLHHHSKTLHLFLKAETELIELWKGVVLNDDQVD